MRCCQLVGNFAFLWLVSDDFPTEASVTSTVDRTNRAERTSVGWRLVCHIADLGSASLRHRTANLLRSQEQCKITQLVWQFSMASMASACIRVLEGNGNGQTS